MSSFSGQSLSSQNGVQWGENDTSERASRSERDEMKEIHTIKMRRLLFLYLGTGSLLVGFILGVVLLSTKQISHEKFPIIIGGYCAILAIILSVFQVMEHLAAFTDQDVQSRIIRILVMVPLYAVTSWLAMQFHGAAKYLDLIRDSYESYAIYTFFSLMMGLLGGTDALLRALMSEGRDTHPHPWPLHYWAKPFYFTPTVLHRIRISILQFMVLKPLCAVIIICIPDEQYGSNFTDFTKGYIYLTVVYNVSITIAFTGLAYFYISTKKLLKEHDPFLKFLSIKGVLFLSYWQSLVIAIMSKAGWLPKISFWKDPKEEPAGLQDFLICCEMLLFAIAHKFVFGAHEYTQRLQTNRDERALLLPRQDMWNNFKLTLRHQDVRDDFKDAWNF